MRHWGQSGSLRSIVPSSSTIANYWQPLLQGRANRRSTFLWSVWNPFRRRHDA